MDQPNILENIFGFLDGKDLFNVRQICVFWKDVCEYLLLNLNFLECEWYRTHLGFLNTIQENKLISTQGIERGKSQNTTFVTDLGITVEVYQKRLSDNINYSVDLVFSDYLNVVFGITLIKDCDPFEVFQEVSLDFKGINFFASNDKFKYEFSISFQPTFKICQLYHTHKKTHFDLKKCIRTSTNLSTNQTIVCENDEQEIRLLNYFDCPNFYHLKFPKNEFWFKTTQLANDKFIITTNPFNIYEFYYLEINQYKTRLVKLSNIVEHDTNFGFCHQRNKIISFRFVNFVRNIKDIIPLVLK